MIVKRLPYRVRGRAIGMVAPLVQLHERERGAERQRDGEAPPRARPPAGLHGALGEHTNPLLDSSTTVLTAAVIFGMPSGGHDALLIAIAGRVVGEQQVAEQPGFRHDERDHAHQPPARSPQLPTGSGAKQAAGASCGTGAGSGSSGRHGGGRGRRRFATGRLVALPACADTTTRRWRSRSRPRPRRRARASAPASPRTRPSRAARARTGASSGIFRIASGVAASGVTASASPVGEPVADTHAGAARIVARFPADAATRRAAAPRSCRRAQATRPTIRGRPHATDWRRPAPRRALTSALTTNIDADAEDERADRRHRVRRVPAHPGG